MTLPLPSRRVVPRASPDVQYPRTGDEAPARPFGALDRRSRRRAILVRSRETVQVNAIHGGTPDPSP